MKGLHLDRKGSLLYIDYGSSLFKPFLEGFAKANNFDVAAGCFLLDVETSVRERGNRTQDYLRIVFGHKRGQKCLTNRVVTAYGYRLGGDQQRYYYVVDHLSESEKMIFDFDGYPVAVIAGQTIYVLLYCLGESERRNTASAVKILELILDDYLLFLKDPIGFDAQMERRSAGTTQKRLTEVLKSSSEFVSRRAWLERVEGLLFDRFGNLVTAAARLSHTSAMLSIEQIDQMYDDLTAFAVDPDSVELSEGDIYIPIGQVDIEVDGVWRDIGKLTVTIDMSSLDLRVINETRDIQGLPHPNTDFRGQLLMGEAMAGLAVLLGRLDLVPVMSMAVPFLRSYNPVTCHEPISSWPIKTGK